MERVKESKYGQCTLYTCMKIGNETCWNDFKDEENNGGN
jgi:hypothetical protein